MDRTDHIRLIDAYALEKDSIVVNLGTDDYPLHQKIIYLDDVQLAPTIDAEPVRHGLWIIKRTGAYKATQSWCSACGKRSGIGGIQSNQCKPYCPNCGAKMDLKVLK